MATEIQTIAEYQPLSSTELARLNTAPLWELARDDHPDRYNHPRRIRQIMDKETDEKRREWYSELHEKLLPMSVSQLWQELGMITEFPKQSWEFFQQFKGTSDMYADPEHKACLHGEDHQDGRVPQFAYVLGAYAGLTDSEMNNVLEAVNVHDKARRDDRVAPNHGRDAGYNFNHTATYINARQDKYEIHVVAPYIDTFIKRGATFTKEDIAQIEAMCTYHELPWEDVPEEYKTEGNRRGLLIQVIQAADAADRFRSPSTRWWPKEEYFLNFFGGDMEKVRAFLRFAAYFTLTSEQERFSHSNPHDSKVIETSIRNKAEEVGIVSKPLLQALLASFARISTRRLVGGSSL